MQRLITKGVTLLMLIGAVAIMAALVSAHAQTSVGVVADIPFDFAVGGQSLKAGKYSVRPFTTSGDAVLVSSKDSKDKALHLTRSIHGRPIHQKATLVFHRYGQRYFLSEVWRPGDRGRQLLKSDAERALENQLAAIPSTNKLAGNSYETVEIVATVR